MLKPFAKIDIMNAIRVHKSLDTFLNICVPKSIMPEEYGGMSGNAAELFGKTLQTIVANPQFYTEEGAKYRVNEKLRPGKPKTERDLFGYFCALFGGND